MCQSVGHSIDDEVQHIVILKQNIWIWKIQLFYACIKKCQNHWTRYSYREFLPSHDASPAIHVENLANFHILTSSRSSHRLTPNRSNFKPPVCIVYRNLTPNPEVSFLSVINCKLIRTLAYYSFVHTHNNLAWKLSAKNMCFA